MPTVEILAILTLVLANGVFAMSEIAVVSSRRARLEARIKKGNKKARVALELATNPNDFLSTIQIGITLIGTLAGAFGGATLAAQIAHYFDAIPLIAPHGESVALALVVIAITYLSLVVGELVPKRLALSNPERFASAVAPFMRVLSKIASPAVRFLSLSTELLIRLIPMKHEKQQTVTAEEVRHMIQEGTLSGTFEQAEQAMVDGVFRLGNRRVVELMTPRQEVAWINVDDSPDRIRAILLQNTYSRFPVATGDLDQIKGFVHVKDLLNESLDGKSLDVHRVLKRAPVFPESMRALRALEALKAANSHIAFIVNEHGSVEGMITITDMLQAVVGDVPASSIPVEELAFQREDKSWLINGMMPVYEFKELIEVERLRGEREGTFTTVGGFVMTSLGTVPKTGDRFDDDGWRYEVLDMDGNRVDKVLVSRTEGYDESTVTR